MDEAVTHALTDQPRDTKLVDNRVLHALHQTQATQVGQLFTPLQIQEGFENCRKAFAAWL